MNQFFYSEFKEVLQQDLQDNLDPPVHNYLMDMKIFEIYKASQKRLFSLKDVINYDRSQLKNIVFVFAPEYE